MPIPVDEKFERYLKSFQPVPPQPLPAAQGAPGARRWSILAAWAAAAAMVGIAAILVLRSHPATMQAPQEVQSAMRSEPLRPLTIGVANALLASSPSTKAAVDGVAAQAFQSRRFSPPEGTQSALSVLSKEKTKL